ELFGHEKGAFTGASAARQGAFELAHGGTLFLDEIGELPLDLQPKLLRVLETRSFRRVGGNQSHAVNIRVIAASKRNLKMEVERGKFREDLYFRLAVVPIELPPLRERREDIPVLAKTLLSRIAASDPSGTTPTVIGADAMDALAAHDWPGNVRELRNVLERAALLSGAAGKAEVQLGMLPFAGSSAAPAEDPGAVILPPFDPAKSYRDTKAEFETLFEQHYVTWLLDKADGNISAAARAADMDRKYLHKLVRKHGLHPKG
ncbi:MAG: sigma-54-dependent Fis family transcriptional regulator, partial [Myxococcales bacterium]|nr:sigma-54-dependent Fis family transcriptional regulator [Myxococcales bacterium]